MSHTHPQSEERKSPYSIPPIQQRHDSVAIPVSQLKASLFGSEAACIAIGNEIKYSNEFMNATRCIWFAFIPLVAEFYGMGSAFQDLGRIWSGLDVQRLWTENATHTVKNVQEAVQGIATSVRGITNQYKAWTVVAPDRVFYDLQRCQIRLQRQQLILHLLVLVMRVLSSSEEPGQSYCSRHPENISFENKSFLKACRDLASTVCIRKEIKEKLSKIDSVDPKDEEIVVNEDEDIVVTAAEEMPNTDNWSSPGSSVGTASPTDDWSDAESNSSGSSSGRSSPSETTRRCRDTDPTKIEHDEDIGDVILETILDGLEDGKMREGSWSVEGLVARKEDLAKLAFHWTTVESFAGIRRADPVPA